MSDRKTRLTQRFVLSGDNAGAYAAEVQAGFGPTLLEGMNRIAGISERLIAAGAIAGDIVRDSRFFAEGACLARRASGLEGLLMSRPFLENIVRQRVLNLSNVVTRQDCRVVGLTASEDRRRVTGIRQNGEVQSADLVVDATGRGSHTPAWLEALGYQKAPEERVEIALCYTRRCFRRRPQDLGGDLAAIILPTPLGKRGGAMLAQEDDQWTVSLIAHFGNYAPEDLPGFVEFAKNLPAGNVEAYSPTPIHVLARRDQFRAITAPCFPTANALPWEVLNAAMITIPALLDFPPFRHGHSSTAIIHQDVASKLNGFIAEAVRHIFLSCSS